MLVDTSIWIAHLRRSDPDLEHLLDKGLVLTHPFVIGEMACGSLGSRVTVLALLSDLPVPGGRAETAARRTGIGGGYRPVATAAARLKDSRFPVGWGFFNFGRGTALTEVAAPLSGEPAASCVECHTKNTAVERTFVPAEAGLPINAEVSEIGFAAGLSL